MTYGRHLLIHPFFLKAKYYRERKTKWQNLAQRSYYNLNS